MELIYLSMFFNLIVAVAFDIGQLKNTYRFNCKFIYNHKY